MNEPLKIMWKSQKLLQDKLLNLKMLNGENMFTASGPNAKPNDHI